MADFLIYKAASLRLDLIYHYTREHWGDKQADAYIHGLFSVFQSIADQTILSRPVPAELGVDGYFCRYKRHYIYWKKLTNGTVGIVTILHEKMHQINRFKEEFDL